MKPWKPLLVLACLALTAASASADVLFRGLSYSPTGTCVAAVDPDGSLLISNIGSSGQDGVSIWSPRSNGARVALLGSCSALDAGSSVSLQQRVSLNGLPPGVPVTGTLSVRFSVMPGDPVSPPACACLSDFSQVSSSTTVTVKIKQNDEVVFESVLDRSTPVLISLDATGHCALPELSISSHGKSSPKLAEAVCKFTSEVEARVGGVLYDCDDISFSCTMDHDCDGLSSEMFVTAPPGSSLSHVRCQDGSCRVFGQWVSGSGASSLDFAALSSSSGRRLEVHNLGSSGQDGVEMRHAGEVCDDGNTLSGDGCSSDASVALGFEPPSLSFASLADVGGSVVLTVHGKLFSVTGQPSPVGEATVRCKIDRAGGTFSGLQIACDHSQLGSAHEVVEVRSSGHSVETIEILPEEFAIALATPGGPPFVPIVALGRSHELSGHVTLIKGPSLAPNGGSPSVESSSGGTDMSCPMQVQFASSRVFVIGGHSVTGDEIVFSAKKDDPGTYSGSFHVTVSGMSVRCPSSGGSLGSFTLTGLSSIHQDEIFADVPPTASLSSAHNCVSIPFVFARTDSTPVRGYSVRFHLSAELAQCGAGVVENEYLSDIGGTQMFVNYNGGGSYTVDCSILGPVCGATGNGHLFTVDLSAVQPPLSNEGVITVDEVRVRDCSNQVVVANPGSDGVIPIRFSAPPAITDLVAVQDKLGNAPGEVTAIDLEYHRPPFLMATGNSVAVYRKGFGHYPEYDNGSGPGSVPTPPASSSLALSSGWTRVTCSSSCSSGACTSTCTPTSVHDTPSTRDFYYYVAFEHDLYDNESPVSNMTPGTLDYHLGDTSDGTSLCVGDNHVSLPDLSFFGSHYGQSTPPGSPFTCLDFGPTTDYSVDGRPLTDSKVEFEDFMMLAINWSVVSAPSAASRPVAAAVNASRLVVPALPAPGGTFDVGVMVDGAGDVQGMSARLAYDAGVLEQVGVAPGSLIEQQGRPGTVLSSGPGIVDAALLGAGPGIAGHGELARVTFRVKGAGDPNLSLASITARDASNHPVAIGGTAGGSAIPARTAFGFAYPNPFREAVAIQLSLHRAGPAAIGVYDVAGRRVRSLVRGFQEAGARVVTWDGRDDSGLRLAPGAYIVRLETAELRESRTVRLVR
jgi:cysteine-rich repeat protein